MIQKTTLRILLLLLISLKSFSQVQGLNHKYEVLNPETAGKIFRNSTPEKDKPLGSPYLQLKFSLAQVENVAQKYYMRYNAYDDSFEFITPKNDTLVLDKIADFNTIHLIATDKTYKLVDYTNGKGKLVKGYLIDFYDKADFVLYKKESVNYYEGKIARTTLENNVPSRYTKLEDAFYLKNKEGTITEFPESKKQLIKLFPNNKEVLETFLKENKISFNKGEDRIKIVDFLATL